RGVGGKVLDYPSRSGERIGGEGSSVSSGHGGAQSLCRLADGKRERLQLMNPTEMFHRIAAQKRFRQTSQPRLGHEAHCSSRTNARLAIVAVFPCHLFRRDVLIKQC